MAKFIHLHNAHRIKYVYYVRNTFLFRIFELIEHQKSDKVIMVKSMDVIMG